MNQDARNIVNDVQQDNNDDDISEFSYADRQRRMYDTTSIGAIMARFYKAVNWK